MNCDTARDAMSARLDDEDPGIDLAVLDAHLATCAPCRAHEAEVGDLHRLVRLRTAEPVPDLTARVLGSIGGTDRRIPVLVAVRVGLAVVGAIMVVVGLSSHVFVGHVGAEAVVHVHRELGAWFAAFGASLLFASYQPDRARGLLPMAAVLGVFIGGTAALDVVQGRSTFPHESAHLLELTGVALLWVAARHASPLPRRRVVLA